MGGGAWARVCACVPTCVNAGNQRGSEDLEGEGRSDFVCVCMPSPACVRLKCWTVREDRIQRKRFLADDKCAGLARKEVCQAEIRTTVIQL